MRPPSAPQLAASFDTPGNAKGLAIDGNTVFVADGSQGLRILKVLNTSVEAEQATACDSAGNCATVGVATAPSVLIETSADQSAAVHPESALSQNSTPVILPIASARVETTAHSTLQTASPLFAAILDVPTLVTQTNGISITGIAQSLDSLRTLTVTINTTDIYTQSWASGAVTETTWTAGWTPDGEGLHTLSATATDWSDNRLTLKPILILMDTQPPTLTLVTTTITSSQQLNGWLSMSGAVGDHNGISDLQVSIGQTTTPTIAINDTTWTAIWPIDPSNPPNDVTYPVIMRASDAAGKTTEITGTIAVDTAAPTSVTLTLSDPSGPVTPGATLRQLAPTLTLTWTASSDPAGLDGYLVRWIIKSGATTEILTATYSPTDERSASYTAQDGQQISVEIGSRDSYGNERWQFFGPIYVDSPYTPDYSALGDPQTRYHGWMQSNCSLIGVDRHIKRSDQANGARSDEQRFYATWDSNGLRLAWTGANWNRDGDLFIYLDTQAGGTTTAYNPYSATLSTTTIYLPGVTPFDLLPAIERSEHNLKPLSPVQAARQSQRLALTVDEGPMGADYLIWIQDDQNANLLRWDIDQWIMDTRLVANQYAFDAGVNGGQTDLALPFTLLGIGDPSSASLDLVAFASEDHQLRLWAVMPNSNPVNSDLVVETNLYAEKTQQFALSRAYHWGNLGTSLCPNGSQVPAIARAASSAGQPGSPDSDLRMEISVEPAGTSYSFLGDNLFWLWETFFGAKTADVSTGFSFIDANHPPLGDGQVITYTLQYQNQGTTTATGVKVDISAYYSLHLPDGEHLHDEYRDHQVVSLGDLAPGEEGSVTFHGVIDLAATRNDYYKPCVSDFPTMPEICDPLLQWASIDAFVYDDTHPEGGQPLEWIWIDQQVDSIKPVFLDIQKPEVFVSPDLNELSGYAYDASSIPTLTLEIRAPGGAIRTRTCADSAPEDGRWQCPWDVTATNNGIPPSDGAQFTVRLQARDAFGQASDWVTRKFIVDTQPPVVSLNMSTTQVLSGSLLSTGNYALHGAITDNHGVGAVEVCFGDRCDLAPLQMTAPNSISYDDLPTGPIAIDAGTSCSDPLVRTFEVAQGFAIGEVRFGFIAEHSYRDDLQVELTSPEGTTVRVLYGDSSFFTAAQHYNVLLADAAPNALHSHHQDDDPGDMAYARQAQPYQPLRAFADEWSAGIWTARICDIYPADGDGSYQRSQLVLVPRNTASTNGIWSYSLPVQEELDGAPATIQINGLDLAGNRSATPLKLNVTFDTVAPLITVTQALTSVTFTTAPPLVLSGLVGDGTGIQSLIVSVQEPSGRVVVEHVQRTGATWQYRLPAQSLGRYVLSVTALDVAGNSASAGPFAVEILDSAIHRRYLPIVVNGTQIRTISPQQRADSSPLPPHRRGTSSQAPSDWLVHTQGGITMTNDITWNDLKTRLIARAWEDAGFKALLLRDPQAAVDQLGLSVPAGVEIRVVEESSGQTIADTADIRYVVLPALPDADTLDEDEISPEELDTLSGGGATQGGCRGRPTSRGYPDPRCR